MSAKFAHPLKPSAVVRDRLREGRKRKGWTQGQLAEAMTEAGWPMDRTTIVKIEKGGGRTENLSLNEVLAFAIVLGMSPVYLMVPWDEKARVALTPKLSLDAASMRWWVSGEIYRTWRPRPGMSAEEIAALQRLRADWQFFQYMRPAPKLDEKGGSE